MDVKMIKFIPLYIFIELFFRIVMSHAITIHQDSSKFKIIRSTCILSVFIFLLLLDKVLVLKDFKFSLITILLVIIAMVIAKNLFIEKSIDLPIYLIVKSVIFAPIVEEIICRKIILFGVSDLYLGIILNVAIFTLLHFSFSLQEIVDFSSIGLLLTFLQLKTKQLMNPIVVHSLINLIILTKISI